MRYGYDKKTGRFAGVYTDDFTVPDSIGVINSAPSEGLFIAVINVDQTAWIEGMTSEDIEKEVLKEKVKQQKEAKEKIIKEKLDKWAEEQVNLDPLANADFYPIWQEGTYAFDVIVNYKDKLFRNEVEGNVNAPDKGGWKEIK